ncbi:MAG: type II secretion system F family protein, partial [Candidatus Heimdallarchaeota archaeon]|nr:type II secretion system F family protein [Candidatus Heimdallarchaeota archaeon]
GGISTSKASRDQLFEYSGEKQKEFGLGALEMKRVRTLATDWNLGYPEALSSVSSSTPSDILSDFLSRFAQAMESGEKLEDFFKKEQKSSLDLYISSYKRSLSSLDLLSEAYQAVNISYVFVTLTTLIISLLFGSGNVLNVLITNLVLLFGVNIPLLMAFKTSLISDPLTMYKYNDRSLEKFNLISFLMLGLILPLALVLLLMLSVPFWLSMTIVGVIIVPIGYLSENLERFVKRRDENFAVFVRTLGGTAEAMGGSTLHALQAIMSQRLGPLSENLGSLVARLEFGIADEIAWAEFSKETGSSLIGRFISIYLESVSIGGSPDQTSKFVSENVERILEVRKDRAQKISAIRGLVLPMHVTMVGIIIFMLKIIILLTLIMTIGQSTQQGELASQAPLGASSIDSTAIVFFFFNLIIIFLTLFNSLVITIPEQGLFRTMFKSTGIMFIVSGFTVLLVGKIADAMFQSFLGGFTG